MEADVNKLYNDIAFKYVDIEDIVLQDHSHINKLLPNITFKFNDDGSILAQIPLRDRKEFTQFIQEQEEKGYLVLGL